MCPLALQSLLAGDLLVLGDLLEAGIDLRLLHSVQPQLGQPSLVVDRNGSPVLHGLLDVVDADVVAEDGAGVGVFLFDGCAGEPDERGAGEGVAHVPGEAVDEVILAAVRLVRDHHDVAAVREEGMLVTLRLGEELLDRREDDSPGGDLEQRTEMGAAVGLLRGVAQEIGTAREGAEKLLVQVVAVREDDERRVLQLGLDDQLPGVEDHGETLPGSLRVPENSQLAEVWMRGFHKFEHALLTLVLNGPCHWQQIGVDGLLCR